jgi:hypothetical protein
MRRICGSHERRRGGLHQLTRERSNVSAHVQLGIHCIGDIFVQCWNADGGDVLRESLRRICGSHERRRGGLHQLTRERSNVSAHVQLWIHGIRDVFVQSRNADRGDLFRESMRRFSGSHERRRGGLHQLTRERSNVSAHVQLGIHGIRDVFVQSRNADGGDVLRESLRCICGSHERRRGGLHQLTRERSNVSAHVQLGIHGIRDVFVQSRNADRGDLFRESMRRFSGSHERRCW